MRIYVAQWGKSAAVRLPKSVVEELRIPPGTALELQVEGGGVRIVPVHRTSEDLLRELVERARMLGPGAETPLVDWGPDRGDEILPEDAYSRGEITPDDD